MDIKIDEIVKQVLSEIDTPSRPVQPKTTFVLEETPALTGREVGKTAVLDSQEDYMIKNYVLPEVGPKEILVCVEGCMISPSDVTEFLKERRAAGSSAQGQEGTGIIVKVGSENLQDAKGNVLKVDSFLNHQMDIHLLNEMGAEFKRRFADKQINKILTIEASGIGIACIAAQHFDVPVVFAKKSQSINLDGDMYVAEVESFTHKCKNHVIVAQKFLSPEDHVLLIDDFLANGCALQGLIQIVQSAGATVEGIGIAVEKGFQSGGRMIRNLGFQLESLAIVDGMDAATGEITFREQPQWDAK